MSLFKKINIVLIALAIGNLLIAIIQYQGFSKVDKETTQFLKVDLPITTNTLLMLNQVEKIKVNILSHIQGQKNQDIEFEKNILEFKRLRELITNTEKLNTHELDVFFKRLESESRNFVFANYDLNARDQAQALLDNVTKDVSVPLYNLCQDLTKEEVGDAGSSGNIQEIIKDDIPGIISYTSLSESVRIMLRSIDRYMLGDTLSQQVFYFELLNAEKQLIVLRGLETRKIEIIRLEEIERLLSDLRKSGSDIMSGYNNQKKAIAEASAQRITNEIISKLSNQLNLASQVSLSGMQDKIVGITNTSKTTSFIINFSSLVLLIAFLGLIYFIRNSFILPTKKIVDIVSKIRSRDKDWHPEKTKRIDEIGEVNNSLVDLHSELVSLEQMREDHMKSFEEEHLSKLRNAYNELQENEIALRRQTESIQDMNTELEQFVHIASHDLREPIKILLGYCDMLKVKTTGKLDESNLLLLEKIQNSGKRMANLIDDLRMLTKLNQHNIPKEVRSIKKIVESIVTDYSEKLKARHAIVNVGTLPTMNCYPTFIWQLFDNLVRNALVHGPEKLQIKIYSEVIDGENVIVFSNNCEKDFERTDDLFLPFRRGKDTKKEGTGIGLSICKKIVELHKGRIWLDKEVKNEFVIYMTIMEE